MPDYLAAYRMYRRDLDGALAQITDDEFSASPGGTANNAAVIIRHLTGNFASRFTDFLDTDGEKPWRLRDTEFETPAASRGEVMAEFERAWDIMVNSVTSLREDDLQATVTIRGKPLAAGDALLRSVAHFASHVGQIIMIGKQFRGEDWRYLSIPPGGSEAYNRDPGRR